MKLLNPLLLASLLLVASLCASHAQTTNLQLRLEPRTNAIDLVVEGDAASGAFFIYQANTLEALSASPTVAVQTNTPLTNGLRFALPAPGASPSRAFFTAAHWPGRSVEAFGAPADQADPRGRGRETSAIRLTRNCHENFFAESALLSTINQQTEKEQTL